MTRPDPINVYDARWESGEFSGEQIRRLFEATYLYGRELGVQALVLWRDARLAAGSVLEIGLSEARRQGIRIFLRPEPISTPQGYFMALHISRNYPRTMGLGITASHNPAQYIGIKFVVPVVRAIGIDCGPGGGLTPIREIYHSDRSASAAGGSSLELLDLTNEYIRFSLAQAGVSPGDLSGISVVLDTFHGSAGPELFAALTLAGVRVEPRRLIPDGSFPSGSPNPTSQGKMTAAVALAGETGCQAAIGIDGDGDRIVFGDGRGILTAGFAFVPILKACLTTPASPVLYDPKVSPLALAEWARLGARPMLIRNGHSQIKEFMTRVGALAAAEESGHFYHRIPLGDLTISAENSILTVLLFLAALKRNPSMMAELWAMQRRSFTTGEFNYQFADDATRDAALDAVVAHFTAEGASKATATPHGIDLQGACLSRGVRLDRGELDAGWYSGYLRIATNERSVVRSYFNAADATAGHRVETEARRILEERFRGRVID
jgi:phosphomannomutase